MNKAIFILVLVIAAYSQAEAQTSVYEQLERNAGGASVVQYKTSEDTSTQGSLVIFLRAIDVETKAPITDFYGSYSQDGHGFEHKFSSYSGGIAEADMLANMGYKFVVSAEGYDNAVKKINIADIPDSLKLDKRSYKDFSKFNDFIHNKTCALVFELTRATSSVTGKVFDDLTKSPISDVKVSVEQDESISTLTNKQGEMQIHNLKQLPPERFTDISFEKDGYIRKYISLKRDGLNNKYLEVFLTPQGKIKGSLRSSKGEVMSNRQIYLIDKSNFETISHSLTRYKHYERVATTDTQGNFMFEDVDPGEYVILFGNNEKDIQAITINPGEIKSIALESIEL